MVIKQKFQWAFHIIINYHYFNIISSFVTVSRIILFFFLNNYKDLLIRKDGHHIGVAYPRLQNPQMDWLINMTKANLQIATKSATLLPSLGIKVIQADSKEVQD